MAAEPLHLVVRAGEAIVCPGCSEELLVFAEDVYGVEAFLAAVEPAMHGKIWSVGKRGSGCAKCGASWGLSGGRGGGVLPVGRAPAPRIHLRSGSWVGWRGIGGE